MNTIHEIVRLADMYAVQASRFPSITDRLEKEKLSNEIQGLARDERNAFLAEMNRMLNLYRQWFDAVQDLNPQYLTADDYHAAKDIYETLGMRVPHSVLRGCGL